MGFENRVELYKAIEHERGKPLITYFTSRRQSSGGILSMDVIPEFCEHIRQIPKEENILYLYSSPTSVTTRPGTLPRR